MFTSIIALVMGFLVCHATYFAIHRYQIVPVLASSSSTAVALLLAWSLPDAWHLNQEMWHYLWFGSSFCGMNNNRHIRQRSVTLVWLLYVLVFMLLKHMMPWPGGSLGVIAVSAAVLWMILLRTYQWLKQR